MCLTHIASDCWNHLPNEWNNEFWAEPRWMCMVYQSSANWFEFDHVWNHDSWRTTTKRDKFHFNAISGDFDEIEIWLKERDRESQKKKHSLTESRILYSILFQYTQQYAYARTHTRCIADWRNSIRRYCLYGISIWESVLFGLQEYTRTLRMYIT